jgi:hypothetical protein
MRMRRGAGRATGKMRCGYKAKEGGGRDGYRERGDAGMEYRG